MQMTPYSNAQAASERAANAIKQREHAQQVFRDYPDKISPTIQERILAQQVVLGMTPYDSSLAAGAFYYSVKPDLTKWSAKTDPRQVMWAQSVAPDDSKIQMRFQTETQYPGEGLVAFLVDFEKGVAVKITKLTNNQEQK